MPKPPRTQEKIEAIRKQILDQAIDIISRYGFAGFTMRRLGTRMGFAAKTIYNYFTSKDEIYLLVLTRGFELLNERYAQAFAATDHPKKRLMEMNRAYVTFGLEYPHYYNIMFNWDVPKYLDYVGTPMEPAARNEKKEGLKLAMINLKALKAYLKYAGAPEVTFNELRLKMIKGWSALHGIVLLNNSRVLQETLDPETTQFFEGSLFEGSIFKGSKEENNHSAKIPGDQTFDDVLASSITSVLEDVFKFF